MRLVRAVPVQLSVAAVHSPDATPADRGLRRRRLLDGAGQPAARRVRALAVPAQEAAGVLLPVGLRRRRPLRRALLPPLLQRGLRPVAHLALPARLRARRGARAPAQAGPDLRRRRVDPLAARRVARARHRRGPARRVAGRCHPLRRVRRFAVLVRLGPDGLPPRRAPVRGPRLPAALQRRALRAGVQPAPGLPRRAAGRHARRLRGLRRRGAALRRRGPAPRRALAPATRAPTASRPSATQVVELPLEATYLGERPKITLAAA